MLLSQQSRKFVPLHLHSHYSILRSMVSIERLIEKAQKLELSALALTDEGNLYGAIEFYKACRSAQIKPIIGCELYLSPGSRWEKKKIPGERAAYSLIMLAKNRIGYRNLCKLSSYGYLDGFYYLPRIDKELLQKYSEGLICLSGSMNGRLAHLILKGEEDPLLEEVEWLKELFNHDLYFELQNHQMLQKHLRLDRIEEEDWLLQGYLKYIRNQEMVTQKLKALGVQYRIRSVATNEVHYLEREEWKAHEILLNIQTGEPRYIWERDSQGQPKVKLLNPKRELFFTHELYLKTPYEMEQLFQDLPDALQATVDIASMIDLDFDFKVRHYPLFTPPEGFVKEQYLRHLCEQAIPLRYTKERLAPIQEKYPDHEAIHLVRERLAYELDIIISKGMCDYILIVHDFISWAKGEKIAVGPGRGSGTSSIVLFLIGITDIEPLRFNLVFERFINPERPSYPDIDVDICMDRRSEVIDYTMRKYGRDKVAQIITFGTMKAKMVIRDVGRILNIPLEKVNKIVQWVPEELGITLDKALETDPDLKNSYEIDEEVKDIINIGRELEGVIRNTGIHAAGIVIADNILLDCIPVCYAKGEEYLTTQFSMKAVEAVGMLKIDFLGLKTLTSIQKTVEAIEKRYGKSINWVDLPLEDKATFELINRGKLNGIFQLESAGMKDLVRQLHIDKFEEIIAAVALYRPGPMEMIPSFIQRKHGNESLEIDHPYMREVLLETYGIMVYQEQVIHIARLLAGYSLGEGDILRRAMGKKDREEMMRQREKFQKGAIEKGIDPIVAVKIFDKIEKFASYGFPKSHAAAYGYLAYATAFFKANYPGEWIAASMTCDRDDNAKVAKLIHEARTMDILIIPPDVNESGETFIATSKGIRFAISGIKGIGEAAVDAIVQERRRGGVFKSLFEFCFRIDKKKVGKKAVESLIEAGSFDFIGATRQQLIASLDQIYRSALQKEKEKSRGVVDFFEDQTNDQYTNYVFEQGAEINRAELLKREKELLGFYLTAHPLDDCKDIIKKLSSISLDQLDREEDGTIVRVAFIVDEVQTKISVKHQRKFAMVKISDGVHSFNLSVWSDLFEQSHLLLVTGKLLLGIIQVDRKQGELRLRSHWLADLNSVDHKEVEKKSLEIEKRELFFLQKDKKKSPKEEKMVFLQLDIGKISLTEILQIKELFRSSPGSTPIEIEFSEMGRLWGSLFISEKWGISLSPQLEEAIKKIPSLISLVKEKRSVSENSIQN